MATLSDLIVKLGIDASNYTEGISKATADLDTFAGSISEKMRTAGDGLKSFGRDLQSLGGSLSVGLTAPILAAFGATTKMAGDFELAMRRVTSLLGDVTQAEFKALSEDTLELSKTMGVDAVGAANSLYEAISAGVPKENAITFLGVASEAAIAGVTNTKVAVDGLTNIMNAFGISMDQTRTVADAMFQAVNIGKFTFEELAGSVGTASGTAAQLGVDFREMLAAAATITKQGFDVTEAFTQIQRAMLSIISPNKQMNELLEKTGFSTGQALINAKGFEGALNALRDAAGGNIQVLTDAYGRVEGLKASLALTGDQAKMAAADLNVLKSSAGATASAFQQIDQSLPRQWERFASEAKFLAIEFGNSLLPTAKNLLGVFRELNESVLAPALQAFSSLPQPVKDVAIAIGLAVAAIGPLIVAAGTVVWGLGQMKVAFAAIQALQLVPMFTNIAFAVSNNLVSALSSGETMLLRFGQAGLIAGAAFAGWKLGEWLQSFTTEYKAAEKHLQALHDQLAAQGVVVERGNKSLEDWARALVAARDQLAQSKKTTEEATKAQKEYEERLKQLQKETAEAQKKEASRTKALEESRKETERLNKINKEAAEKTAKYNDQLIEAARKADQARIATESWNRGLITIKGTTIDYIAEAGNLVDRIGDIERATKSLKDMAQPAWGSFSGGIQEAAKRMETLDDAYKTLGQTSKDESDKIIAKANAARDAILGDPNADEFAKRTAIYKALKIQVEQATAMGQEVPKETRDALSAMEKELETNLPAKFENPWKDSIKEVSTNVTNAAQDIVGILIGTRDGSVWDALKKLGSSVLTSFVEPAMAALNSLIETGIKKLVGWLLGSDGVMGALGSIGRSIGGIFSGASGAVGEGVGGAAGQVGGAAGGVGGAVSGAIGGALSGTLGAVFGGITAGASIFSAVMSVRQEGTLNAIEENTRFGMIHTLGLLLQANEYWPVLKMIYSGVETFVNTQAFRLHDIYAILETAVNTQLYRLHDITGRLNETYDLMRDVTNAHLAAIQESVAVLPQLAVAGTGGSGNITINLTLDGQKISEVVIDNMGRQLNQSGQILR